MIIEMKEDDFIISKTDTKGRLTYVNKIFMDMAEYTEAELLGQPHNIVRNQLMPKLIFKLLWERVQNKEEIFAYVVNKTKHGNDYWVYANVTASLDERGDILGFYSVRRMPNPSALEVIKPLYIQMVNAERSGGIEASKKILDDLCKEKGVGYDELIISLQK
ncbi:PAS domain-containing protein [bacterium]|nr:PAS domain-containing protein [bacterium]MBU1433601.1 PAS domain-containing protein [bacterium]MBU1503218.1 PAS domain-containing protein [bacterium]